MRGVVLIAILCLAQGAAAGFFQRWCEKHLVSADPYQYETVPRAYLERRIGAIQIRKAWGKATAEDLEALELIQNELELRDATGVKI